jgi:hypothetical protein
MALLPDNTTRDIDAVDVRRAYLSLLQDRGAMFANPASAPWTIPIPAVNTWVDIPLAIPPADRVQSDSLFWRMDANGQLGYNYAADWPTVAIPPGYIREVLLLGVVEIDANGLAFEFAFTIGGVVQLPTYVVDTATSTQRTQVVAVSGDPIDVSVAPKVSMSVRNLDSAADLEVTLFSMRASGGVRAN